MEKEDIINLVKQDQWMMEVLQIAQSLDLPDWMIGAGFLRNKIWDYLHGYKQKTPLADIDLIYFDQSNTDKSVEKKYEGELKGKMDLNWSVNNHARMHLINGDAPYVSTTDGLAHWVETATCIAIKLNVKGELELIAPYGIDDLVNLVLRPSPKFSRQLDIFYERISRKQWLEKWPKLKVLKK